MHRMTRDPREAEVRAPFDGTRFTFHDAAVVLEQRQGERFMRIEPGGGGAAATYRVTRVIGGRTREDFAGVEVGRSPQGPAAHADVGRSPQGPAAHADVGRSPQGPAAHPDVGRSPQGPAARPDVLRSPQGPEVQDGRQEVVLPVSFVYATRSLRYKGYSVMVHERATLRPGPVWARTCIFCHNTVPEVDRLLGAIAGPRARAYQGEQVDRWLPPARRARVRVTDADVFALAARDEVARLGGTLASDADPRSVARGAIDVVRSGFDGGSLVEEGIGCEACHGGSVEHVRNPRVRPSLVPTAPWLDVTYPQGAPADAVNRVCARCHQVLFSRYPYTWEGGRRDANAGGSHINSGEARDFLLGGCSTQLACSVCHNPHGGDTPAAMNALETPAGNKKCTPCHTELADPERLRSHAHHDPTGAGGACIACHMARKNMGLDGRLTPYHRIGSPTDSSRVLGDRPLECALCHADATVRSLADRMEAWWSVRYPRQRLEELYGSLDANVLRATLERGHPHEQAVAIAALARVGARDAVPLIEKQLTNEYPLVREWAARALGDLGVPTRISPAPVPGVDEDAED
jgi:predicted CXXCH cytochrome family protein